MSKRNDYGARVRIWDNGGKTFNRYTIMPPASARGSILEKFTNGQLWECVTAAAGPFHPFHPQGIGQHTSSVPGKHLGKRIHWDGLPADVQNFARQSFPKFCPELTYPVLSIDAWVDGLCGGWQWNNWHKVGDVPRSWADMTARQLLRRMRGEYLHELSKGKLGIEDDGHNIVIIQRYTRKPLFAIDYGSVGE